MVATAFDLGPLLAGTPVATWVFMVPLALLAAVLVVVLVGEAAYTLHFTGYFSRRVEEGLELKKEAEKYQEIPATVCISLKGADPALPDLIKALARQTHRAWHLRFIIDSREDPAWPTVHNAIEVAIQEVKPSWSSVTIEPLEDRMPKTGVRLGSALRQHMSRLHPDTQVALAVDGDATMVPGQLTSLVAEVFQPGVGVVSGVRWIDLPSMSATDCIRAMWNNNCLPTIAIASLPWGGIMAIRRELIEAGEWDKQLRTGFNSDLSLVKPIRSGGWKYAMVPAAFSIEADPAPPMSGLLNFLIRQTFGLHIHHHNPLTLLIVANSGPLVLIAIVGLTLVACAVGALPWYAMGAAGMVLLVKHLTTTLVSISIHEVVRRGLARVGLQVNCPLARWAVCSLLWATAFQFVTLYCAVKGFFMTEVDWRGVVYRRENGIIRLIRDDNAEEDKEVP